MITKTLKKLREAKFFLQLLNQQCKSTRINFEAFEFYLSAFLSAARSVTFALQYEEKQKYDNWYSSWERILSVDDLKLLGCMKEQRNAIQKEGEASVKVEWEMVPVSVVHREEKGIMGYRIQWVGLPVGTPEPQLGRAIHFFTFGENELEVIMTSERYLDILERLVQDFLKLHPFTHG